MMLSEITALGDRFDSKRGITDSADDDWLWTAACFSNGYGAFRVGLLQMRAHVLAYIQASGALLLPGEKVCHTCDVKRCSNNAGPLGAYVVAGIEYPRYGHLWLGTMAANHADRNAKGRQASGDNNGMRLHPELVKCGDEHPNHMHPELMARGERQALAKLTEQSVRDIRTLYATGNYSTPELGREFGVHYSAIQRVIHRHTWKHVD